MSNLRGHLLRPTAVVVLLGGLLSACLGQDFLDLPLGLDRFDHGWRANVEVGEEFGVDLVANPLYLDVPWKLADVDASIVRPAGSEHVTSACTPTEENPCPESLEGEPFVPHTAFSFTGVSKGESPLRFELEVDGRVVDLAEYTIAVVDDACGEDLGISANRCDLGDRDPNLEVAIFEHGTDVVVARGDTFTVTLAANAMYPDAAWRVAEIDSSVLTLQTTSHDPVRSPGDWDTTDPDKPWQFLPIWRLTFAGTGVGESPLVLEVVSDGERVEVFEVTVRVAAE